MAGNDAARPAPISNVSPGDRGGDGTNDDSIAFFPAANLLDALSAVRESGGEQRIVLGRAGERDIAVSISCNGEGHLQIGVDDPTVVDECEALRQLAHQMAAQTDTPSLLELLCESATKQCGANGAAVLQIAAREAELIVATGPLSLAGGRRFALRGSLAREVLKSRDIVSIDDFSTSARPLTRTVPGLRVGPMLLAPLIAHNVVVGVIVVARDLGALSFSRREGRRLRVIADYAALALWKADLLEQAQVADRAKSRFLATVSHELRTPLTALAGYEELLVDQVIGPISENQLDVLERMRSVTQHLASVIEDVLTFSSLDERRDTIRATDFLAADLVRAAAAVIEPLARQKRLTFTLTVPEEPIRLTSDVDKIRQILINLAANAVKFTESGEVQLELYRRGRDVCFAVRDTGIGIDPRDFQRLFKPFVQLDTGLTRKHGGTGLGLYISRGFAELLGGSIEVESGVGSGSTFRLCLPDEER